MKKILILMIASLLVSSCTIHPLGIPDETWQKMTPQQQADAYQKQADIDAKQRAQELAYKQQQEQQIADIKANPRYGEYIQCVIDNGKYQAFINDWNNDIQAFSFDAIKDKTTTATLTYYRNNDKFFKNSQKLYISFTGTQIKVCKAENSFSDDCSVITATLPQYQKGVKVMISSGIIKAYAQCDMIYNHHNTHSTANSNIIINI
ncbi:hypothetical protein IBE20_04365 [Francisella tularensis subsp. novicida]|uniref:Uncharacterized protein n=2 Tax=Francisella tularensis TaxID=263 RepID=A0Q413_FRATN|nr:hypothetical protein [Francisella tularensis]ABK88978.1 protein of unknown function [Francisella tularensis subsp. novicida U112]AJI60828.1 hypothetical protein AW25_133 [Francisella tularensis subsp. novicida U112]EDX19371.1 lipoprotein, putative [Francisella tularensis subsp. novicida FTE]MBK2036034.1 hypothetical protein [Francisella tularensis subsp. novicida]MBK2115960.1 hypothetical protein [Francisella tularensis subsp. novicida]